MDEREILKKADVIAKKLAIYPISTRHGQEEKGIDSNEVAKVFRFFLRHQDWGSLDVLLKELPNSGLAKRSRKTREYYRGIKEIFSEPSLKDLEPDSLVRIMGWAIKLSRYYK